MGIKTKITKIIVVLAIVAMTFVPMMGDLTPSGSPVSFSFIQPIEASAASVQYGSSVITGCFNGNNWSGYTRIYVNNARKTAKIKVCAFKQNGRIESGKFKVDIYSDDWQYCTTKWITGSATISLNYGYSGYRIRFRRTYTDGTNVSRTQYWSVDAKSNIYSMF